MKLNFKKISAIAASTLLAGMSVGLAAAANYPAPFVNSAGAADVAVVYGTGAGVSSLDLVQAGNIQTSLASSVKGGTTTIDGESFKFEKTSTKFHLGDNITGVVSTNLDDDQLPTLLESGKYIDNDNDEIDYTQKIAIGAANQLSMFEDNDYVADQPTLGFRIPSGQNVLTYTLTFEDSLLASDMPTTNLPLMNKNYYVLSNTSTTLTLLDSATEAVLAEGDAPVTIGGKTVFVDFISSTEVKLNVDGEVTNSLAELQTFKLNDGTYVGIKDITAQDYQGGVKKVEFSIGNGKLKITNAAEVQINDQTVSGLVGTYVPDSSGVLSSISLAWAADDDLFVTEESSITMPGFEAVSLSYGGLTYPSEETIEVTKGGDLYATLENFPLKDGEADINFLYATTAGAFAGIGKDASHKLVTSADSTNLTFDKDTDDYFVISWSDGNDAESYLARFSNFVLDGSTNKTDLEYYVDGAWTTKKAGAKDSDVISLGNAEVTIYEIDRAGKNAIVEPGTNVDFHTLYSKEGATVYLPYLVSNSSTAQGGVNFTTGLDGPGVTGHNNASFYLVMKEEDQNENKYSGDWINATIGWDSSSTAVVEVSSIATSNGDATSTEIGSTDVWRDFTYSALATEILYNKPSGSQKSVKLIYHGDEVAANVYVTPSDAVTTTGALGDVLVKDSEVSSVASKNLVIVGGSCINSAAATALGGAYCGNAFTAATGVSAGEFLIKGVQDKFATGKLALVVAGYEAADTVNAATYLTKKVVDTSKEYKGTSATEATLVTTAA
ncbi:hypothetical protein COX98_01165 [Candidatus Pacearchaeota archaeon CG_4_10_14_0_2_um_filter_30_11]|nr:MAG: hypothetical protein COX98_01165 [Candidatus Pacearchaeota archaeon CG_4_10_14_0_2_um_filter_30_11]